MDIGSEVKQLQQNIFLSAGYIQCLQELQRLLQKHPQAGSKVLKKYLKELEVKKTQEHYQDMGGLKLAQRLFSGKTMPRNEEFENSFEEESFEEEEEFQLEEPEESEEEEIQVSPPRKKTSKSNRRSGIVNFSRADSSGKTENYNEPLSEEEENFFK